MPSTERYMTTKRTRIMSDAPNSSISEQAVIERLSRATAALGEQILMQVSDSD